VCVGVHYSAHTSTCKLLRCGECVGGTSRATRANICVRRGDLWGIWCNFVHLAGGNGRFRPMSMTLKGFAMHFRRRILLHIRVPEPPLPPSPPPRPPPPRIHETGGGFVIRCLQAPPHTPHPRTPAHSRTHHRPKMRTEMRHTPKQTGAPSHGNHQKNI
jgi:hypothetical protein